MRATAPTAGLSWHRLISPCACWPLRSGTESTLISPRQESIDVAQVVQALSNGLRSDVEIAKTTRLAHERVHIALSVLVRCRCVVGSPSTLFRLTDNGKDMVKSANATERKHQGLRLIPHVPQGDPRSRSKTGTSSLAPTAS
jgi:hypothetical protein